MCSRAQCFAGAAVSGPRARALAGVVAAAVAGCIACSPSGSPGTGDTPAAGVTVPAPGADFDYQIGGAYPPPPGVRVVGRDRTAQPAAGIYNICYLNAFQAQPDSEAEWGELVLRAPDGAVVMDQDWNEALLDLRTAATRERIAAKVNAWVDDCAAKGYQAIEPDNYDSFTRSRGLLSDHDAQAYVRLLSAHAHARGLAVAQKNTAELAARHRQNGLDFAIAEECGEQGDCEEYTAAFGDHVIVIEYTAAGSHNACTRWGRSLSVVRRDRGVTPAGAPGYLRTVC